MKEPRLDLNKVMQGVKEASEKQRSPVMTLEQFDAITSQALLDAKKEMETIGPSLRSLAHRIEKEKPDIVVFLDLSARIFGSPYKKYLAEIMGKEAPSVQFYNDHELKAWHLATGQTELVEADFEPCRGKKVFFIDETFSEGKGAIALLETAHKTDIDAYYFALTKDPEPVSLFTLASRQKRERVVEHHIKDGRIVIYDNPIKESFSRFASRLYVEESHAETRSPHVEHQRDLEEMNVSEDTDMVAPEGMTMDEYNKAISIRIMRHVANLKRMVYEALVSEK